MNLPPVGPDIGAWASEMRRVLSRQWSRLVYKATGATASDDGVILWDASGGYPVVSKSGEWRQVVLADGYAVLTQDNDITAAAPNTAYAISWDTPSLADGVSVVSGSRVTFAEGGTYFLTFSAQIYSTSASDVAFYFWPAINGTNVPGSTMVATLHSNGSTTVVARGALFQVAAGDYLEAMWAVDDTNGSLYATPATAFSPAAPSATLAVTRIRA